MKYQALKVPIVQVFDCMSGNSGLTEEFIYSKINLPGQHYTVLSSSTEEGTSMGKVPMCQINGKPLKVFEGKDGLLIARNGKAGTTRYLVPGMYTTNDHAYIISVKKNCPYKINLRWFAIQYRSTILSFSSSSDNGTWNKTGFFKEVEIDIPKEEDQLRLIQLYGDAIDSLDKIEKSKNAILNLIDLEMAIDYSSVIEKSVPVKNVLNCMGGNSGLTAELIYSLLQSKDKKYIVLSGATLENNYLGDIPYCEISGKPLKTFENKEGLLIVRKGKAGETKYLPKGDYTINDDAYILSVKEKYIEKVDIRWFRIQYRKKIMEYSSSSDNGTWNKTGFFENVLIDIPDMNEQLRIVKLYEDANKQIGVLEKAKERMLSILKKEIIS